MVAKQTLVDKCLYVPIVLLAAMKTVNLSLVLIVVELMESETVSLKILCMCEQGRT